MCIVLYLVKDFIFIRFSSSTSPMRGPNPVFAFAPSSSTPELADDEDSEGEPDGVLQRVADLHKFNDRFFRPGKNLKITTFLTCHLFLVTLSTYS